MWPCAGLPALGWLRFGGIDHPALVAQRESPAQPGPGGGRGLEGCGAGSGPGRGTDLLSLSSGAWGQPAAPAWERSGHGAALPSVSGARPGLRPPTQGAFAFVSTSCGSRNRQRGGGWGGNSKCGGRRSPAQGRSPGQGWGGTCSQAPPRCQATGDTCLRLPGVLPQWTHDSKLLKWPPEQVRGLGTPASPLDGQDARAKLGQGRVWGEEDGDWAAPQLRVGWGWHINRGAPSGHHRGLCRRRGVLVDLAFACFGRASRGQRGIRTPICWPLSLAPHKLSLDVGARRVGRGRGLP